MSDLDPRSDEAYRRMGWRRKPVRDWPRLTWARLEIWLGIR